MRFCYVSSHNSSDAQYTNDNYLGKPTYTFMKTVIPNEILGAETLQVNCKVGMGMYLATVTAQQYHFC